MCLEESKNMNEVPDFPDPLCIQGIDVPRREFSEARDTRREPLSRETQSRGTMVTWLKSQLPSFLEKVRSKCFMLTLNILPEEASLEEAWEIIKIREAKVIRLLQNLDDILYVIGAIEVHEKKKKGRKGKEKLPQENLPKEGQKFVHQVYDAYSQEFEVKRVFSERDETLRQVACRDNGELLYRVMTYLQHKVDGSDKDKYSTWTSYFIDNRYDNKIRQKLSDLFDPKDFGNAYNYLKESGFLPKKKADLYSTEGYPHLHLLVACTDKGKFRDKHSLARLIYDNGIFPDVFTSKRKGKPIGNDDFSAHRYVLKNVLHELPYLRLKRNPVTLYNLQSNPLVNNFFYHLLSHTSLVGYVDGVSSLISEAVTVPIRQVVHGDGEAVPGTITDKPIAEDDFDEMINYVNYIMERDNLALSNGVIFKKTPSSKYTWEFWGDADKLFYHCSTRDKAKLMKKEKSGFYTFVAPNQQIFPEVVIDFSWVEFQDFFLNLPTGTIVRGEQYKFPSFSFIGNICFDDIASIRGGELQPSRWNKILLNSKFIRSSGKLTPKGKELFRYLYQLLLRKRHKEKSLALYGEPNSCKSSLIAPLLDLYHHRNITTITKAGGFELENIPNSQIILLEEFKLQNSGITFEQLLKILEIDSLLTINGKFKKITNQKNNANAILIGNDDDWMYEMENGPLIPHKSDKMIPALAARIDKLDMTPMADDDVRPEEKDKMVREEKGIILLQLALEYFSGKLEDYTGDLGELKKRTDAHARWTIYENACS